MDLPPGAITKNASPLLRLEHLASGYSTALPAAP